MTGGIPAPQPLKIREAKTMDVLADIFDTIQLKGTFYFRTHFSPPWGTTVPRHGRAARFHYVVRGRLWIRAEDHDPIELSAGDFVLVPGGASHVLADRPSRKAPPLETVMESAGYKGEAVLAIGRGDPSAATQLVCGHLTFSEGADHAILRALPPVVRISAERRIRRIWFNQVLGLLVRQVFKDEPGALGAVTRLSEILFIEAIRFASDDAPELKRLLEGFADTRIGRAIALIHKEPARPWTVEDLAREIGMSRTRFAHRFQDLIGMGPVSYLIEWRLQRAAVALRTSHRTIAEIAYASGYSSQAAFARAFRERFGQSPKAFRSVDEGWRSR
jgi:AraC family transcriptional regulator, activator of mtrCDE